MLSYRLKYRENQESEKLEELQREIKLTLSPKHVMCDSKKS